MTSLIPFLLASVLVTSFISGVLSLAGGSILMGIFGWVLPVSTAMILHGVTQAASNGARAWIYREHIQWNILGFYFIGAVVCTCIFALLAFVPSKAVLFLFLGGLPFVHLLLPKGYALDITRRGNGIACGFLVTASLLVAGVSGPILDVYYVKTSLTRFQIHATKGLTQAIGHLVKVAYFGAILGLLEDGTGELPFWLFIVVVPVAYLGILAAKRVVHALVDQQFKNFTQYSTMIIGIIFLAKGIQILLTGEG